MTKFSHPWLQDTADEALNLVCIAIHISQKQLLNRYLNQNSLTWTCSISLLLSICKCYNMVKINSKFISAYCKNEQKTHTALILTTYSISKLETKLKKNQINLKELTVVIGSKETTCQ